MGQLFDGPHLAYIVVSLSVTASLLVLAKRKCRSQRAKDAFLKTFGILTFLLHVSVMWYDFLADGSASAPDNVLFPIYFCNLSMYMLLIVSFWGHRDGKFYRAAAIMTAYGGFFGAMISLIYPEYYFGSASLFAWPVFKSMASHSTMLVGALWLFVGGYVPIRRSNTLVYAAGLGVYGLVGLVVNGLFAVNGLPDPNAMYLSRPPLAEAPFLNCWTIAVLMLAVIHGTALAWERIAALRPAPDDVREARAS
jgi:hypothetical protein